MKKTVARKAQLAKGKVFTFLAPNNIMASAWTNPLTVEAGSSSRI
jgi:hypothetical protein